jgi:DnaJ-class molecular chaperone
MDAVAKAYKSLSRKYHPDMDLGDEKKFKEINDAHKILKKELS